MDEETALPTSVEVLGMAVPLDAATVDLAVRYDVVYAAVTDERRAFAAALGVCWPRLLRRVKYRFDPLAFGGRVVTYLCGEQGAAYLDVVAAGRVAYAHLAAGLVDMEAAKAAEDFTAVEPGGSGG